MRYDLHYLQGRQPQQKYTKLEQYKDLGLYNSEEHLIVLYIPRLISLYMMEDYDLLCVEAHQILSLMRKQVDSICTHIYYFFYALGLVARYPYASKEERKALKACLRKLKELAKRSPRNAQCSYLLIRAEWMRLKGHYGKAYKLYRQAVEALDEESGYWGAIVYERKGLFEWQLGHKHSARITLNEAYKQYNQWGIERKKAALLDRYGPQFILTNENTVTSPAALVDHMALLKATQDLSKEIDLKRLVVKLLKNVIQNAGAQKGVLILSQNGRWQIEAETVLEQDGSFASRLPGLPMDDYHGVPRLLIQYVIKTRKKWVSHDASNDTLFEQDTYMEDYQPHSVLCTPIIHQQEIIGIIYLENNLIKGAFTEDKVISVQHLATQAAISIINARLYEEMKQLNQQLEEKVKERTASLKRSQEEAMKMVAERAVLEERQRLAKNIHDVIGHSLTIAIVQLESMKRLLQVEQMDKAMEALNASLELIRLGQQEIRRSIRMLGENDLSFDLIDEINRVIHRLVENTSVEIEQHIDLLPPLDLPMKKVIYHALMEGLTNGIRHARVKKFFFSLTQDGDSVTFKLTNDGVTDKKIQYGFGLSFMEHAVNELGGTMQATIDQDLFTLQITLPLKS